MPFGAKDALLRKSKALPNGAATIYTDGIDLENTENGDFVANCDVQISAPVLTTTEVGDTQTITYSLQMDTDPAFGSPTVLFAGPLIQTGAAGAGAAAATWRARLPSDVERYIRCRAVKAGASNASTASVVLELLF